MSRLRSTLAAALGRQAAAGALDRPRPGEALAGERLAIEGWALFASGPPVAVQATLAGRSLGAARLGLPRPDVALGCPDPAAGVSGFSLSAPLGGLPAGEAELRLRVSGARGEQLQLGPLALTLGADQPPAPEPAPAPAFPTPAPPQRGGARLLVAAHRLDLGGAQLYLCELLEELVRRGEANPTVVGFVEGPLRGRLEAAGIPVHVSSPLPEYDRAAHLGRVEELVAWAAPRRFEAVLVNTASSFAFPVAEVAARLGIPAIWAIHESYRPQELWEGLDPAVRALGEEALGAAELCLFESAATMELYRSHLSEAQAIALPYGVDLEAIDAAAERIDRAAARAELAVPADAELILCLGAIEPRKAQVPLAQAFAAVAPEHPGAHLAFLGEWGDEASSALAAYARSLPCAERIHVRALSEDVHPWHAAADLLACPSDLESLPRAVLEAMAWRTPVLGTEVFGTGEVIADGATGWLCRPRDTEALAAGLRRALAASEGEREAIASAAREQVERRHTLAAYATRFAALLEQTLVRAGAASGRVEGDRQNGHRREEVVLGGA